MVIPGDRLKLEVKIIKTKRTNWYRRSYSYGRWKIVAKGELTFAVERGEISE